MVSGQCHVEQQHVQAQTYSSTGADGVQEGGLMRCEACDARYHGSCLGYSSVPSDPWFCPECQIGGRGECAGALLFSSSLHVHLLLTC
jgi:hypothetical protein